MKTTITATALVVLALFGAAPVSGQAQWDTLDVAGGGREFQLRNDAGDVIILVCQIDGLGAGFAFGEPIQATERATVRGTPGGRENISVAPVNDRMVQIAGARGLDFTMELLRTATRLSVRASGRTANFEIFGSASIVSECVDRQEELVGAPRGRF